ncbi:MAG: hypothetical protein GC145_07695 [Caulobacter sp.]|nr:hypothetical protein [Caulobacter sp.]
MTDHPAAPPAPSPLPAAAAASPAGKRLTARQQRFVDLMLMSDNAAEAARRAGYRPVAAKHTASRLLARPDIQAALAAGRAARAAPLSRAAVLEELRDMAFCNMLDYVSVSGGGRLDLNLSKLTRAQAAGFRELTVDEHWNRKTGAHHRRVRVRIGAKAFALTRLLAALDRAGEKRPPGGDPAAAEDSRSAHPAPTGCPPPADRPRGASR